MRPRPADDRAVQALEGVLMGVLLVTSVAAVSAFDGRGGPDLDVGLDVRAADVLRILEAPDASGRLRIDALVTDALLGRPLGSTVARMLPPGAGWQLSLGNGHGALHVAGDGHAYGTVRTASTLLYPDWTHGIVVPLVEEHAVVEGDTLRVAVVPVSRGWSDEGPIVLRLSDGTEPTLEARGDGVLVSVAVPPAPEGELVVDRPLGEAGAFTVDGDAPLTAQLADALAAGVASVATPTVPLRGTAEVAYDLSTLPLLAAESCRAVLRGPALGNVVLDEAVPCGASTWRWTAPAGALLGTYVLDLRVEGTVDAAPVTAHDVVVFDVVRPAAEARAPQAYTVSLSIWTGTGH